jgi:SAM-dependent methyltransferase
MDVRDIVAEHYGGSGLTERILAAYAATGADVDHLEPEQLTSIDELHAGFAPATEHLLDRLSAGPGVRLLDVGCGIGGPSRLAARRGCTVTGVDVTEDFVRAATELTARTGLGDHASFHHTPAQSLPFGEGAFDAAMMIHVGMNIPDKQSVFTEVHRVLAPGGRFGLFEQMRTGPGALPYPLPWADDERSSFVEAPEDYAAALRAAGFSVVETTDRTAAVAGPPRPGAVPPTLVMGADLMSRIANNIAATESGLLGAFLVLAEG